MGFNPRDLQKFQAQAQAQLKQMMKMQEDLASTAFEGTSGGGAITITINGKNQPLAVKIDPEAVDPEDMSMLEDLILAAFKDAYEKVSEAQSKMTSGLNLPPGMGF